MNLYNIPFEVRCPECGSAMMTGPGVSRLIIPNRMYARCLTETCGHHGKRFTFKIPLLAVESESTDDEETQSK